jgi:preprotein translocase subunit SecG
MIQQILLIVHILSALAIIGLILLQHGKGAEVGAAFGSGASQTLFGSRGATSFLAKITSVFALFFAITSVSISYMAANKSTSKSVVEKIEEVQKSGEVPVLPAETKTEQQSTITNHDKIDDVDSKNVKSKAKKSKAKKKNKKVEVKKEEGEE